MLAVELLSEPHYVPDTPVAGLSHIEDQGDGQFRLVFYSKHKSPYGGYEYPIEIRMIATYPVILAGVVTVLLHMGARFRAAVCRAVCGRLGETVH